MAQERPVVMPQQLEQETGQSWISIAEAARRLGISSRMLWRLVQEGQFKAVRSAGRGRRTTVDETKVREYASALEAAALMKNANTPVYGDTNTAPEPDGRIFIRAVEAAKIAGVSRQRMSQVIAKGEILAVRIGRCLLLRPSDVRWYKAYKDGEKLPSSAARASVSPNAPGNAEGGCDENGNVAASSDGLRVRVGG
jgi:excisionase family DNA binding protein